MTARARRATRGLAVLALVMFAAGVIGLLSLIAAQQSGSARRAIERSHALRLMQFAAQSAFEEACARIEAQAGALPRLTMSEIGARRRSSYPLDAEEAIPVPCARKSSLGQGVTVGDVRAGSARWHVQTRRTDRARLVQETGMLTLSVPVTVRVGATTTTSRVVVRRYMELSPDGTSTAVRLRIQPRNLTWKLGDPGAGG